MSAFSTLVENADTLENARKTRKNDKIRNFLVMSAFSTLVENADTLENTRKTRKNDKISNF